MLWKNGLFRGVRTAFQTLGGTLPGFQLTLDLSFAKKLGTALVSAVFAGVIAFVMNVAPPDNQYGLGQDDGGTDA